MTTESASSKNWELTLYELHRKPQEPITDGTVIAVSPRSLKSELMCPICLDILKVTMTTKECLHRFCSECIITALRSGNKECPTCRKKLVSKRSLRRDPNFDALIAKIYPTRQEYEAHQDKILARLNRQHLNAALTRSLEQQLGLDSSRSRNTINGRSDHGSATGSGIANSSLHDGNTDNAASEEETSSAFAVNISNSARRMSHVNSDTESGVETNSVGEASSVSVFDIPSRSTVGSSLGLMDNPTQNLLNNHVCPMDGSNIQGNVIHSTNSNMSPSIFPEIEILLKPHPRYIQRSVSPSASGSRTNSSVYDSGNGTNGLVKYVKAPTITTVDHLCRYLTVRVNLQRMHREVSDDNVNFVLYTYNETTNTFTCVDSHMSVEEISRTQCPGSHCLDLYYARGDVEDL